VQNFYNEGPRGSVQRLDVRGKQNPSNRERPSREGQEFTFTAKLEVQRNRDKDLLTEPPKKLSVWDGTSGNNQ
jgi:hypothetical protein